MDNKQEQHIFPIISDKEIAGNINIDTEARYNGHGFIVSTFDVLPLLKAQRNADEAKHKETVGELILELSGYAHLQSDASGTTLIDIPTYWWQQLKAKYLGEDK